MSNVWKTTSIAVLTTVLMSTSGLASVQPTIQPTDPSVGLVDDIGSADRIKYSDRLRTLTQTLASAACHLNSGIDVDVNKAILENGIQEFDYLSTSLRYGNAELNIIGEEGDPKTKRAMELLEREWTPMKAAFSDILETNDDANALSVIYNGNDRLLKWAGVLETQLEAQYSNPTELLQSDAMLMEISGKQSMTTQRLSFIACKIQSGTQTDDEIAGLKELAEQFDFSVRALQTGRPELGLNAAPTPEISAKLADIIDGWDDISGKLNTLASTGVVSQEDVKQIGRALYQKMETMEKVTHLYTEYSRRVY